MCTNSDRRRVIILPVSAQWSRDWAAACAANDRECARAVELNRRARVVVECALRGASEDSIRTRAVIGVGGWVEVECGGVGAARERVDAAHQD